MLQYCKSILYIATISPITGNCHHLYPFIQRILKLSYASLPLILRFICAITHKIFSISFWILTGTFLEAWSLKSLVEGITTLWICTWQHQMHHIFSYARSKKHNFQVWVFKWKPWDGTTFGMCPNAIAFWFSEWNSIIFLTMITWETLSVC